MALWSNSSCIIEELDREIQSSNPDTAKPRLFIFLLTNHIFNGESIRHSLATAKKRRGEGERMCGRGVAQRAPEKMLSEDDCRDGWRKNVFEHELSGNGCAEGGFQ